MSTQTALRLVDFEIHELAKMLRDGRTTSVALTQAYLDRIDQFNGPFETFDANGGYNAFVRIDREGALAQAQEVDDLLKAGAQLPLLAGIPIGIKDSIAIAGRLSTNGWGYEDASTSVIRAGFEGNIAVHDAEVVAKLRKQKVVILGHTTCSELSGDVTGLFAGNAWDMRYAAGGSSQGSGVAPIARLAAAAIGVETGGSIVVPAAANGASAIKPAPGAVSAAGVMQGQAGMDVPGPMARSVRDAALILNAIYDRHSNPTGPDSEPSPAPLVPTEPSRESKPLFNLRIGIPLRDWMKVDGLVRKVIPYETYEPAYRATYERFKGQLISLGVEIVEFEDAYDEANAEWSLPVGEFPGDPPIPLTPQLVLYWYNSVMLRQSEDRLFFANSRASEQAALLRSKLPMLDQIIERTPRIELGHRARSERARHRFQKVYQQALDYEEIDFMLVLPLGAKVRSRVDSAYLPVERSTHYLPNLLGWPMVVFPIGIALAEETDAGIIPALPISAAFWGPRFSESIIIQAAIDFQAHFPEYHMTAPPDPSPKMMHECVRRSDVPRVWPVEPGKVNGLPPP